MPESTPLYDWVIASGMLITPAGLVKSDLGILGEKIAAAGTGLRGRQSVDASGMYVIPGGVDPHVHLEMPVGVTRSSDDWQTGSTAAAWGGTTTLIDFVEPAPGQPLAEALQERIQQAHGRAVVDYALHMTLTDAAPATLNQLEGLADLGCTSFKVYTAYPGLMVDDPTLLSIFAAARARGALVMVHAENQAIIDFKHQQLAAAGTGGPAAHPLSRPALAEIEAVQRALALAETARAAVYIVHLSTAGGAVCLEGARKRGVRAFGETCPQYLLLDDRLYSQAGFEGAKYVCSPPLRTPADQDGLWQALSANIIQSTGTDHCPFNFHGQKDLGIQDYTLIPGGLPGVESRLALLYSNGVVQGRLSLARWVEVCSSNPARLFGLYPRKGSLEPGSDADVVLFDPRLTGRVMHASLHENVDYTPYEGFSLQGQPAGVFLRGAPLFLPGKQAAFPARGEYLKCGPSHDPGY